MVKFKSYSTDEERTVDFVIPEKVKSINFSYDGGRLSICINDFFVYENKGAGNDFNVDII